MRARTNDQVIEDSHFDEGQGFLQSASNQPIGFAGLRIAGWMVVRQHGCCSVDLKRATNDLARVDARTIDRATEKPFSGQHLVPGVEPNDVEFFVRKCADAHAEKVG